MRSLLALCVMFALVGSAVAASTASAEPPEFKVCVKAAKVGRKWTGNYRSKCVGGLTEAQLEEGKLNKYERIPWTNAESTMLRSKGKGKGIKVYFVDATEEPPEVGQLLSCTGDNIISGEVTGPKRAWWKTVYTGCSVGGISCHTGVGYGKGEITTQETGTLVYLQEGTHQYVGFRMRTGPGNALMEYECGRTRYEEIGERLLRISPVEAAEKVHHLSSYEGEKHLPEYVYEEQAPHMVQQEDPNQANAVGYFRWNSAFTECVTEEIKEGHSDSEAEEACSNMLGPWPDYPLKPIVPTILRNGEEDGVATRLEEQDIKGEAWTIE